MPKIEEIAAMRSRFNLSEYECAALIHVQPAEWMAFESGDQPMHPAFWELFRLKTGHSLPEDYEVSECTTATLTTPDGRQWARLRRREKWPAKGANTWPVKYRLAGGGDNAPSLYLYERSGKPVNGSRQRWAYPWSHMADNDVAVLQVRDGMDEKTIDLSLRQHGNEPSDFDVRFMKIGEGRFYVFQRVK